MDTTETPADRTCFDVTRRHVRRHLALAASLSDTPLRSVHHEVPANGWMTWGGADLLVTTWPIDDGGAWHWSTPLVVATPHAFAVRAVIDLLREDQGEGFAGMNKYEFYGRLGEAVRRYQVERPELESQRGVVVAMLEEALGMVDDMEDRAASRAIEDAERARDEAARPPPPPPDLRQVALCDALLKVRQASRGRRGKRAATIAVLRRHAPMFDVDPTLPPAWLVLALGEFEAMEELTGRDGEARWGDGETPAHFAVQLGMAGGPIALAFILADCDLPRNDGSTPLHLAAAAGDDEMVRILLICGADPERRDARGRTPSELAREAGHDAVARRIDQRDQDTGPVPEIEESAEGSVTSSDLDEP